MPALEHRQVVILGAGFAGLAVARALGGTTARVTVIDRQNHHLFQPLLYQVATASLSGTDIAQPVRHVLRRFANIEILRGEATGIDRGRREVILAEGKRVRYDILVVATGAETNYFGHDDWERAAPGLKTLSDAQRARSRILEAFEAAEAASDGAARAKAMTFAIVGGGPTGVEMAGSVAELARQTLRKDFRNIDPNAARVILFEGGPAILPAFPPALIAYAERELSRLGVEIRTGQAITAIDAHGVTLGGETVPAETVIWAAGVRSSPAGRWLGVETDRAGRVPVDATLRLKDDPSIFVLGDIALALDSEGRPLPGLAQVARQEGSYAGEAIRALLKGLEPAPFRYRNLGAWAIVGRNAAIARIGGWSLRGGSPGWPGAWCTSPCWSDSRTASESC